jgi:hypothetical protein
MFSSNSFDFLDQCDYGKLKNSTAISRRIVGVFFLDLGI